MAAASVMPNSRKMRPVCPSMKEMGKNTDISVMVVAITAKAISRAPTAEASSGFSPSSIRRWIFSTSTIASSTTMPMASTMASNVSVLTEKPKAQSTMKVGTTENGIAATATSVERQSRKKTRITSTTSRMPSTSVLSTPSMEARMKTPSL